MSDTLDTKARDLKLSDCFAKSTWTAIALAVFCFAADAYVALYIPLHRSVEERGLYHPSASFVIGLRSVEAALAGLACWLVYYAFSRPPRLPAQV